MDKWSRLFHWWKNILYSVTIGTMAWRAPPMDIHLDRDRVSLLATELERRRWLFDQLPIDPLHAEWFKRRAWVRTLRGTTRIEGNTLSDLQIEDLLENANRQFPRREALEILGIRTALQFVDDIVARTDVPIGEDVVREIHRRVLDDIDPMLTPGAYRQGPNRVADPDVRTIFETPPSGDVPALMRAFGLWLRDGQRFDPPIAAAVAHLEFVAIHPFYDGNGRTARALARLLLGRGGYGFGGLVSLDAVLDMDRERYFRAIAVATGGRYEPGYDATPFVEYFVSAAVVATDHVLGRLRGLGNVMVALRRDIVEGRLPAPMIDGLAYAWVNRSIRPADYVRITRRTGPSASRDLDVASKLGFLVATGETRGRRYLVGPALRAIHPE
jgi:Fic family protein